MKGGKHRRILNIVKVSIWHILTAKPILNLPSLISIYLRLRLTSVCVSSVTIRYREAKEYRHWVERPF